VCFGSFVCVWECAMSMPVCCVCVLFGSDVFVCNMCVYVCVCVSCDC